MTTIDYIKKLNINFKISIEIRLIYINILVKNFIFLLIINKKLIKSYLFLLSIFQEF